MRTSVFSLFGLLAILAVLFAGQASAQGYSVVLEKLDNFENRIASLEQNGSSTNSASPDLSDIKKSIAALKKEVEFLKSKYSEENYNNTNSEISYDYNGVQSSLAALRSDVDYLQNSENSESQQYAEINNDLRGLIGGLRDVIVGQDDVSSNDVEAQRLPINISGFGDVYSAFRKNEEENDDFELGQVEVDLETDFDGKLVIAAAIAYDAGSETFGLGAFTADLPLWSEDGGHFDAIDGISNLGIVAGQFDVPFGIDWYVYPSIERKLVSSPLVVENTHDGWNDYGFMLYADNQWGNAVVYGTNGFGYESVDEIGDPMEIEMNMAAGARVGVTPKAGFEVGASYSGFFNEDNKIDMVLMGADLQWSHQQFSVKGEYIIHQIGLEAGELIENTGYYAQGTYDWSKYFITARYGLFSPDITDAEDITRFSGGIGWRVLDNCQLRYEYQSNSESENDVSYLQMVVGF